ADEALGAHQPFHRAPRDRLAFTLQLSPDLAGPVDAEVLPVNPRDLTNEPVVSSRPRGGRPGPAREVGARSDRAARLGQRAADRLDPEHLPVVFDVVDDSG